jgi:hypothetical protein
MSVILYILYAVDGIAQVLDAYEMLWDALEGVPARPYILRGGRVTRKTESYLAMVATTLTE